MFDEYCSGPRFVFPCRAFLVQHRSLTSEFDSGLISAGVVRSLAQIGANSMTWCAGKPNLHVHCPNYGPAKLLQNHGSLEKLVRMSIYCTERMVLNTRPPYNAAWQEHRNILRPGLTASRTNNLEKGFLHFGHLVRKSSGLVFLRVPFWGS